MDGHQAFEGMKDGDDDVCCILCSTDSKFVKPMFLDGTEPLFKSVKKSGCLTTRLVKTGCCEQIAEKLVYN